MPSSREVHIREWVADYLSGAASWDAFRRWIFAAVWQTGSDDPGAHRLAAKVALYVSEYEAGHRTEPDFRDQLRPIVTAYDVDSPSQVTGSSVEPVTSPFQWAGTGSAMAPV